MFLIVKNCADEVDTVVETIEQITEVVEKVAEVVDKVAEDIADDLPEGGRFRKAVVLIENVAEQTAKDAHLLEDIIHKVYLINLNYNTTKFEV